MLTRKHSNKMHTTHLETLSASTFSVTYRLSFRGFISNSLTIIYVNLLFAYKSLTRLHKYLKLWGLK